MRICVLGTGSIGSLILGALCSTEHDLVAVSRGETAMRLSTEGLVIHRHDGSIDMIPPTRFTVIDTDCLLYTSPSPRDNKASRMPSSA